MTHQHAGVGVNGQFDVSVQAVVQLPATSVKTAVPTLVVAEHGPFAGAKVNTMV